MRDSALNLIYQAHVDLQRAWDDPEVPPEIRRRLARLDQDTLQVWEDLVERRTRG